MSIADAVVATGISRSTLYELIAAGKVDARKEGTRTLVLTASLADHIASLPKVKEAA